MMGKGTTDFFKDTRQYGMVMQMWRQAVLPPFGRLQIKHKIMKDVKIFENNNFGEMRVAEVNSRTSNSFKSCIK